MKTLTCREVGPRKAKAVHFLREMKDDAERAGEVDAESVDCYAKRRGFYLSNAGRRKTKVVDGTTKAALEGALDEISDLVDEALDPELSREELVAKVKEIGQVVEGGDEEEDEEEDYETR